MEEHERSSDDLEEVQRKIYIHTKAFMCLFFLVQIYDKLNICCKFIAGIKRLSGLLRPFVITAAFIFFFSFHSSIEVNRGELSQLFCQFK